MAKIEDKGIEPNGHIAETTVLKSGYAAFTAATVYYCAVRPYCMMMPPSIISS